MVCLNLLLAVLPVVPAVRSERITECQLPPEGYRIRIGADGTAKVEAADAAGRFYAEQTLAQLSKPLKPCEIEDWPEYPFRSVLVDDARLCYGKEGVKRIIDQMAKVKLNVFHWHFTEPGAWRMEVPGYGKVSEKLPRGQRYSREDMREIVDYAAARHVRVMPEVEMPGHNDVDRAYPEFRHGEPPSFGGVCPANPETIRFFKAALTEAAAVFPETMIHFGGDEVSYASWKKCPRCQAKMKELGLKTEADLQAWFMGVMADHLKSLGKTPVGWSDMLLTLNEGHMHKNEDGYWTGYGIRRNLSKDIVINAWYGDWECAGGCGAVAANLGYKVIQYPSNHTYFDHGQGLKGDTHKYAYTTALTLRDAYEWNPVSDVRPECRANVVGVGCANWSEKATDLSALEWKLWPRGFATAEVGWCDAARRDWKDFEARARGLAEAFRLQGVNAAVEEMAGKTRERVVYQEEFDRFGAVVPEFNAGAGLGEVKNGTQCLKYEPTKAGEFRSGCFKVGESPKERQWKISFLYRFDRKDIPNDFTLKLLFGDRNNPDVRTLTVSEAGSHFGCDAVPSPKDGMCGFLANRQWNKGAITVKDGGAAFWCWRGGRLTKDCETDFPAKPLVGWNLAMLSEKGGQVRFDRMAVTDGTDRPYDRGDPTEWLQEPQDAGVAWDAAFGTDATKPVAVDFTKNRLDFRFRRSDFSADAKGRYEPITVRFDLAKGKPRQIVLTPKDVEVKIADRRFVGGVFSNVVEKTKLAAECLTVTGDPAVMSRERINVRPSVQEWDRYLPREIAEIYASYGKLPKLANRVFGLMVVGLGGNRYRVFVDGQVLCELQTDEPVVAVSVSGAEARAAVLPRGEADPQVYRLPLAKGGFRLERVRENLGSFWLECNGYLQRNGFDRMPDACVFNVPRRQWVRARARCHVDPTAPATAVPVITARLTHFERNGGRSLAMCERTVDLRDASAKVRKVGAEYEVTFDFDIGSIQDLTSMEDGLTRRELAYLSFEFTGPLWEKNRYYMDPYRLPAEESVSSLVVTAGELEASPADFTAVASRPFSLYYPDEPAGATVTVTPRVAGEYTVVAEVRDETEKVVERQEFRTSGTGKTSRTVNFEAKAFGYYDVDYILKDGEGRELQRHSASFGRIRPDTRKAGYESPYYSWNFRGAHGTPWRIEDWGECYRRLGIRRTTLAGRFTGGDNRELREDSPECRKYGITHVQFPYFRTPPAQRNAAGFTNLVRRMKTAIEMYPHCRTALVFHESGFGPFPKEVYGEATEIDDEVREKDRAKASEAEFCARAWRTADPTVKLIHGNSSSSIGLISRLLRAGYPKDLVDAWGEEDVGMTYPPEMSTALLPWEIKKAARFYGYTEAFDCPREWKSRYYPWRQARDKTPAAGLALRDVLIAHALGYTLIPVGAGTETANSYADSIWCSGTFARWPLAYPRKFALATAAHTQLMDGAKFVRQVPTGSLTVYALEFAKDGGFIYALWSARGEVAVTGGAGALVGMTGRELAAVTAKDVVTVGEEPCYLLASGKTAAFVAARQRNYPRERFPAMAKAVVAATAEDLAQIELRCVKEPRIEKGYDSAPVRVGRFELVAANDTEKGACVELRHVSKPACPEIMTEYATLAFKDTKPIEGVFSTLGVWVKGNSNWGKVYLEFEDAEGEVWFSAGMGGVGCQSYDWCGKMALNYDGWNFLQLPLTSLSPVKIPSPGDDEWQWTRDGSGNGRIDFPIRVKSITIGQMGRTLDLLEMKSGADSVRIKSVELW